MIVAFAGSRPLNLGGYQLPNPTYISVCQKTEAILKELKPTKAISGMALGYDQYAAYICIKLGIPFIAAIPFIGQEGIWPKDSQIIYKNLLGRAESQHIVSEGGYSAQKLQIRNEWMVDNCDVLIACYDAAKGSSGTFNCIQYAEKRNKKIYKINP